jgi:alpha-galactosidase
MKIYQSPFNPNVVTGRFLIVALFVSLFVTAPLYAADRPVKVFILAGQSTMKGKAPNALLDHQATDAKTRRLFAHLRKDDRWIVRDDVFNKFLDRKGPVTVGYGSPPSCSRSSPITPRFAPPTGRPGRTG